MLRANLDSRQLDVVSLARTFTSPGAHCSVGDMTLRKGDEVEIKASVMFLGTLKSGRYSGQRYLNTLARYVRKVGAEQPPMTSPIPR
jgi:hypothetical protein